MVSKYFFGKVKVFLCEVEEFFNVFVEEIVRLIEEGVVKEEFILFIMRCIIGFFRDKMFCEYYFCYVGVSIEVCF